MKTRWIIAAAAGVALAVLLVPMLGGRSSRVEIAAPSTSSASPACKAESQANLDFTVKDMNGGSVALADYKGKVLLINFWATWCPPCKIEIPGFNELYAQYRDQGFEILGVSGDDDAPTLRQFAAEYKISYPMLVGRDEDALLDAYGPLFGYPTSFIVGRDGAVCAKHVGPATKEELERQIKALL